MESTCDLEFQFMKTLPMDSSQWIPPNGFLQIRRILYKSQWSFCSMLLVHLTNLTVFLIRLPRPPPLVDEGPLINVDYGKAQASKKLPTLYSLLHNVLNAGRERKSSV